MAMFVVRRRHRMLYLVLAVLAFSTWGLWLAHTGRATDYSNTVPVDKPDPAATAVTRTPGARPAAATSTLLATAATSRTAAAGSQSGSRAGLAGVSSPMVFARRVATVLLAYDSGTDFTARTASVMAVAALPPLGNPAELKEDLTRYTPDPAAAGDGLSVRFSVHRVSVSAWAATRITQLHLPDGSFGIDITGRQIITRPGTAAVTVSVTLGMTGACPPALAQCELDRVFPQTVRQELDQ